MSRTILLVEDEPLLAIGLEDALVESGFDVVVVNDGISATFELENNTAVFLALVTDIQLGTGPNGWQIGRRARQVRAAIPVIYMSGDSAGEWSKQGVNESRMLTKPFAPSQLVDFVSMLPALEF
jgi:DNA-binding response OmpR family regulator